MKEINLTKLIKDNYCYFDSYRQGLMYYRINYTYIDPVIEKEFHEDPSVEERFTRVDVYQFVIPIDDLGNATLNAEEKAGICRRWIRIAHEKGELIKVSK